MYKRINKPKTDASAALQEQQTASVLGFGINGLRQGWSYDQSRVRGGF